MPASKTVDRESLEARLAREMPDSVSRNQGYALVNVLPPRSFAEEHIPGSINIPFSEIARFEERFSSEKEIIVYCASPECDASTKAAHALRQRGFENVYDYESGLSDWKQAGNRVVGLEL